jgi:hypothetical protein
VPGSNRPYAVAASSSMQVPDAVCWATRAQASGGNLVHRCAGSRRSAAVVLRALAAELPIFGMSSLAVPAFSART